MNRVGLAAVRKIGYGKILKLDPDSLAWQFDVYRWLFENFGGYSSFLTRELVLPTADFFPDNTPEALFESVKRFSGMSSWPCRLETYVEESDTNMLGEPSGSGTAGHFTEEEGEIIIRYNVKLANQPLSLVATFAHELAHYQIFHAVTEPPQGWAMEEYATDLTAVFLGFGIFLANSSFHFSQWQNPAMQGWTTRRQGYLGELDLAYGLALFCLLKDSDPKVVLPHLRGNPKSYFKTGIRHLRKKFAAEMHSLTGIESVF